MLNPSGTSKVALEVKEVKDMGCVGNECNVAGQAQGSGSLSRFGNWHTGSVGQLHFMLDHLQRPLIVPNVRGIFMKLLKNHCNRVQSGIVGAASHVGFCSEPSTYMKKWHEVLSPMPLLELSHASIKIGKFLDLYINCFISFEFEHFTPLDLHEIKIIITLYIENDLNFVLLCNHDFLMRSVDMRVLDNRDHLVHNLRRDHTLLYHQNRCRMRNRIRNRRT